MEELSRSDRRYMLVADDGKKLNLGEPTPMIKSENPPTHDSRPRSISHHRLKSTSRFSFSLFALPP